MEPEASAGRNSEYREMVIDYFTTLAGRHGSSPAGVGWSAQSQLKRFEAIVATLGDLRGASVLDVGCGSGHFMDFLIAQGIACRYRGIDMTPAQVELARRSHPECSDVFSVFDVHTPAFDDSADYVVANGLVNRRCDDPIYRLTRLLAAAFKRCKVGTVITCLSTHADQRDDEAQYFDPAVSLNAALKLTRHVRLDHTYLPHDFALILYR